MNRLAPTLPDCHRTANHKGTGCCLYHNNTRGRRWVITDPPSGRLWATSRGGRSLLVLLWVATCLPPSVFQAVPSTPVEPAAEAGFGQNPVEGGIRISPGPRRCTGGPPREGFFAPENLESLEGQLGRLRARSRPLPAGLSFGHPRACFAVLSGGWFPGRGLLDGVGVIPADLSLRFCAACTACAPTPP